jgi:hypothetical protein
MKKGLLFTFLFGGIIAFSSCSKKEYTCSCTETSSYTGSTPTVTTFTYNSPKMKEDEAESWCNFYESSMTTNVGGITMSDITVCDLN